MRFELLRPACALPPLARTGLCVALLVASGCSLLFTRPEPDPHYQREPFACTTSYVLPAVDVGGGLAGIAAMAVVAAASQNARDHLGAAVPVLAADLAVIGAGYVSYRRVAACREAQARWAARHRVDFTTGVAAGPEPLYLPGRTSIDHHGTRAAARQAVIEVCEASHLPVAEADAVTVTSDWFLTEGDANDALYRKMQFAVEVLDDSVVISPRIHIMLRAPRAGGVADSEFFRPAETAALRAFTQRLQAKMLALPRAAPAQPASE